MQSNNTVKKSVSKLMFPHHDFLGIQPLSTDDIQNLLDLSEHYVIQNRRKSQTSDLLRGQVLINIFLENSTRTRLSFEMAAKRLGADVINMSIEGSSIKKGESFTDTLKTINAMLPDLLVIRHQENGAADTAADILDCPVINGGDGTREHPTQAVLDALTLRRHFGRLDGLKVAICGDIIHSRVAHSNMILLKKMGAHVSCIAPQELLPAGATNTSPDLKEGLADADAVMVLRLQKERFKTTLPFSEADYFNRYGLTHERLGWAKPGAMILHPGPMNRGIEIDAALADDPARSLITTQVEMGVAVRMACLDLLTRNKR